MRLIHSALALTALLLAALGCGSSGQSGTVVSREGEPDLVRSKSGDPLLERAMQKAKDTHLEFVAALNDPKPSYTGFGIKKGFPTPDGGREHMWISDVVWSGSEFRGVVNNEPVDTQAVRLGDEVTVRPDELSDWMYLDGRRLVGGYTVRVLFSQSSPEQQEALKADMDIPPVDF